MFLSLAHRSKFALAKKAVSCFIASAFLMSLPGPAGAQMASLLPTPGAVSPIYAPPLLKGLNIHPENPFLFDFIVNPGVEKIKGEALKAESEKLVKFFLAAMTIPDKEAWVNLSPYEADRIIPDALGKTEMGKVMLEQDYLLKQMSSSLTNPETDLGKKFWSQVRTQAQAKLGTTDVPMSTFNKVWIVPAKAEVAEKDGKVYVTKSSLKVMLEEDYDAMQKTLDAGRSTLEKNSATNVQFPTASLSSQVFRSIILPNIEKEVNEGKEFAPVRQIYDAAILAVWYKQALKESLLGKIYADKSKVKGVETDSKDFKKQVYNQYLEAFKKGAYNFIKEDFDMSQGESVPRRYFSGGMLALPNVVDKINGVAGSTVEEEKSSALVQVQITEMLTPEEAAIKAAANKEGTVVSLHFPTEDTGRGGMNFNTTSQKSAASAVTTPEEQEAVNFLANVINNRNTQDSGQALWLKNRNLITAIVDNADGRKYLLAVVKAYIRLFGTAQTLVSLRDQLDRAKLTSQEDSLGPIKSALDDSTLSLLVTFIQKQAKSPTASAVEKRNELIDNFRRAFTREDQDYIIATLIKLDLSYEGMYKFFSGRNHPYMTNVAEGLSLVRDFSYIPTGTRREKFLDANKGQPSKKIFGSNQYAQNLLETIENGGLSFIAGLRAQLFEVYYNHGSNNSDDKMTPAVKREIEKILSEDAKLLLQALNVVEDSSQYTIGWTDRQKLDSNIRDYSKPETSTQQREETVKLIYMNRYDLFQAMSVVNLRPASSSAVTEFEQKAFAMFGESAAKKIREDYNLSASATDKAVVEAALAQKKLIHIDQITLQGADRDQYLYKLFLSTKVRQLMAAEVDAAKKRLSETGALLQPPQDKELILFWEKEKEKQEVSRMGQIAKLMDLVGDSVGSSGSQTEKRAKLNKAYNEIAQLRTAFDTYIYNKEHMFDMDKNITVGQASARSLIPALQAISGQTLHDAVVWAIREGIIVDKDWSINNALNRIMGNPAESVEIFIQNQQRIFDILGGYLGHLRSLSLAELGNQSASSGLTADRKVNLTESEEKILATLQNALHGAAKGVRQVVIEHAPELLAAANILIRELKSGSFFVGPLANSLTTMLEGKTADDRARATEAAIRFLEQNPQSYSLIDNLSLYERIPTPSGEVNKLVERLKMAQSAGHNDQVTQIINEIALNHREQFQETIVLLSAYLFKLKELRTTQTPEDQKKFNQSVDGFLDTLDTIRKTVASRKRITSNYLPNEIVNFIYAGLWLAVNNNLLKEVSSSGVTPAVIDNINQLEIAITVNNTKRMYEIMDWFVSKEPLLLQEALSTILSGYNSENQGILDDINNMKDQVSSGRSISRTYTEKYSFQIAMALRTLVGNTTNASSGLTQIWNDARAKALEKFNRDHRIANPEDRKALEGKEGAENVAKALNIAAFNYINGKGIFLDDRVRKIAAELAAKKGVSFDTAYKMAFAQLSKDEQRFFIFAQDILLKVRIFQKDLGKDQVTAIQLALQSPTAQDEMRNELVSHLWDLQSQVSSGQIARIHETIVGANLKDESLTAIPELLRTPGASSSSLTDEQIRQNAETDLRNMLGLPPDATVEQVIAEVKKEGSEQKLSRDASLIIGELRAGELSPEDAYDFLVSEGIAKQHMAGNNFDVNDTEIQEILNIMDIGAKVSGETNASAPINGNGTKDQVGGINFDPTLMNLQVKRDKNGVPLPLPQQDLQNINIEGLYPVIINIAPATMANFPLLSKAQEEQQKLPVSKAGSSLTDSPKAVREEDTLAQKG